MDDASSEISTLETHLGYWLRFVSNHVSHGFARKLEAEGVTAAEWVVLRELLAAEETAPSQVAERLGLTRGAVSKLVERLVDKGLVYREANTADRRAQRLSLTSAGRELVPRLARIADENDAEFFGHLTAEQRDTLMGLLRGLVVQHRLKAIPIE